MLDRRRTITTMGATAEQFATHRGGKNQPAPHGGDETHNDPNAMTARVSLLPNLD